jgi:hypothetical protein
MEHTCRESGHVGRQTQAEGHRAKVGLAAQSIPRAPGVPQGWLCCGDSRSHHSSSGLNPWKEGGCPHRPAPEPLHLSIPPAPLNMYININSGLSHRTKIPGVQAPKVRRWLQNRHSHMGGNKAPQKVTRNFQRVKSSRSYHCFRIYRFIKLIKRFTFNRRCYFHMKFLISQLVIRKNLKINFSLLLKTVVECTNRSYKLTTNHEVTFAVLLASTTSRTDQQ